MHRTFIIHILYFLLGNAPLILVVMLDYVLSRHSKWNMIWKCILRVKMWCALNGTATWFYDIKYTFYPWCLSSLLLCFDTILLVWICKVQSATISLKCCHIKYVRERPFDIYRGGGQKITREANFFSRHSGEANFFFFKNHHNEHNFL